MSREPLAIDAEHCGVPHSICVYADPEEGWIVDPGPESCSATVLAGLPDGFELRRVLLTHIHFDHAGGTGALLRRWPDAEVWVSEVGARHLIDPTRLVASATRIYGDDFARLWGEVVPVPEASVRTFGEAPETDDGWRVAFTPGHAKHHVAYLHEGTGIAYTGDVGGVRIDDGPTLPPTPPPDIDLELWHRSIDVVAAWDPAALACTHFGLHRDPAAQLAELHAALDHHGELGRTLGLEDFIATLTREIAEQTAGKRSEASYAQANPGRPNWEGLQRYWQLRREREAA